MKKNATPRIKYTPRSCAPSSQFVSPSEATSAATSTAATSASSSNWLKTRLRYVPKSSAAKTSTGATKSAICRLEPSAISRLSSILFLIATSTATRCSATFPMIGIRMMPRKNSLRWSDAVTPSTLCTRISLSHTTAAVAAARTIPAVRGDLVGMRDRAFLVGDAQAVEQAERVQHDHHHRHAEADAFFGERAQFFTRSEEHTSEL